MPELPEVETIVRDLRKKIKDSVIVDFWSDWKKSLKKISFKKFQTEIRGRKIIRVRRLGKNIFIDLSGGKTLYIHLKMTGHLLVKKVGRDNKFFQEKVNQYIHHIWYLCSPACQKKSSEKYDLTLEFSDLRKFAKIMLMDTDKIEELKEIKELGVDVAGRQFTLKVFQAILQKRPKSLIGSALMDQKLLSGIGNIYRSEILFQAKISPFRRVKNLKSEEIKRLYQSIKKIIKKAIERRGTSDSDYRDTQGRPGGFHRYLRVYRRENKKCWRCPGKVKRDKLGQRSVFWCPQCQK